MRGERETRQIGNAIFRFAELRIDSFSGELTFVRWRDDAIAGSSLARLRARSNRSIVVGVEDQSASTAAAAAMTTMTTTMAVGGATRWSSAEIALHTDFLAWSLTAPLFASPAYTAIVVETTRNATPILRVQATNKLGALDDNDRRFSIVNNDEVRKREFVLWLKNKKTRLKKFAIDAVSGEILLVGALDFESLSSYEFNVLVADRRNRTASVAVVVYGERRGDKRPLQSRAISSGRRRRVCARISARLVHIRRWLICTHSKSGQTH